MLDLIENPTVLVAPPIETPEQFRDALERLRHIEIETDDSPRGRERAALELRICQYLASCEKRVR